MSCKHCTKQELAEATPTDVVLITAAGEELAKKKAFMVLDALCIAVDVLVLPDTPDALSVG